jgi:hypothetical protein
MKKCPSCSARNDDQAIVCSLCSARLTGPGSGTGTVTEPRKTSSGMPVARPSGLRPAADPAALEKSGPIIEPRLWQQGKPRSVRSTIRVAERHFLVPPFGDLLQLQPGEKPLVVGRDEECDVTIASPTVSRRHAEIQFRGLPLAPVVRDLGTKNGTRVNGKKLPKGTEKQLADGDILRVGDVTAIYRLLPPGEDEQTLRSNNSGTVQMQADDLAAGSSGGLDTMSALKGDLAFFPMPDLLARLAKMRASGTLTVEIDGVKGKVAFLLGAVQNANVAGMEGPGAVQAISDLRRGRFKFEPGKGPAKA